MTETTQSRGTVALFATCLVDLFRPSVGFASAQLLEQAGYTVDVPEAQTCCGQPAYNNGDNQHAAVIARQVIEAFRGYDYVVVPSGSCGGTITSHYPDLLRDDPQWAEAARELAGRTWELTRFLVEVAKVELSGVRREGVTTYHDSCSGLREMGIRDQPRALLGAVEGLELREMADTDVCCGFGGTFCVKYPEISERLVSNKVDDITATGADTVLAGDLGCLFNIAGRLQRLDKPVRAYHVAEVLAGTAGRDAAIGEGEN
ncbi:(Fe-S)-binding protein [Aquisalimonas asiatica]|uniref:L-lactate dehydrogenase complex protein LldE n=1 Tax=Aquisalimonas asiatica TaxID=406100 RepID=A0A1H8Q941_9GAMM|nr:(Fe-S)-binding protein [Aquisalimonas asiatica]SEO50427.1 L-lactate dehydrogenase complex protein LldE [Aquisalimonas asiatica]